VWYRFRPVYDTKERPGAKQWLCYTYFRSKHLVFTYNRQLYKEAVLKAVNLGQDTDTTGAVTGGLAGLLYGIDGIPASWVTQLARWKDIDDLAKRLTARFASR
jgi:hypothetical protein